MNEFISAFLPNFASTISGVVIGLPIALYINRNLMKQQLKYAEEERKERLSEAAYTLIDACQYNLKVLDNIAELAMSAKVMRNPDLRTTTWDALKHTVTGNLTDPELLQLLSHHWLRLKRFEELNSQIFLREAGIELQLQNEEMMLEYWGELYQNAINLSGHCSTLIEKLEKQLNPKIDRSESD